MEVRKPRVSSKVLAAHERFNLGGATTRTAALYPGSTARVSPRSLASGSGGERAAMHT